MRRRSTPSRSTRTSSTTSVSLRNPDARRGDITILHVAVPSPMSNALAELSGGRVIQYHNITPAHCLCAPITRRSSESPLSDGIELAGLVGRVDLALGDSEYNRRELEELGFDRTGVFPVVVNTDRITRGHPVPALEDCLGDGLSNILFVGRIAPNKRIEDHIRLAEHFKRYVDTDYRFIFVGRDRCGAPLLRDDSRSDCSSMRCPPTSSCSWEPCQTTNWLSTTAPPKRMSR